MGDQNMTRILKIAFAILAVASVLGLAIADADARNKKGSRRVYPGHGKGSHYVGGK
jgi:hypothetical protein